MTDLNRHATFLDAVLAGDARPEDVDDWVERWHFASTDATELHERLGMTWVEYGYWARTGDLDSIIAIRRANGGKPARNLFWVSWFDERAFGEFELTLPWRVTAFGGGDNTRIIKAAVVADDETGAREVVYRAYAERPASIEFGFVLLQERGWQPFTSHLGEYPRAGWMCWPDPSYGLEADRPREQTDEEKAESRRSAMVFEARAVEAMRALWQNDQNPARQLLTELPNFLPHVVQATAVELAELAVAEQKARAETVAGETP